MCCVERRCRSDLARSYRRFAAWCVKRNLITAARSASPRVRIEMQLQAASHTRVARARVSCRRVAPSLAQRTRTLVRGQKEDEAGPGARCHARYSSRAARHSAEGRGERRCRCARACAAREIRPRVGDSRCLRPCSPGGLSSFTGHIGSPSLCSARARRVLAVRAWPELCTPVINAVVTGRPGPLAAPLSACAHASDLSNTVPPTQTARMRTCSRTRSRGAA